MATITHLASDVAAFVDNLALAIGTPTANRWLVVGVLGSSDFHADAFSWSISDTGGRTWTPLGVTATAGTGTRRAELRCWTAPTGGSPAATTVTVDAFATNGALYVMTVGQVDTDPALITGSRLAVASGSVMTATFDAEPVNYQSALALIETETTGPTFGGAPTHYSVVNSFTEGTIGGARILDSTVNTSPPVTQTVTAGAGQFAGMILIEWAPDLILDQDAYRWGLDDGTETGHTWAAAENTLIEAEVGQRRLFRAQVEVTGAGDHTGAMTLQYKRSDEADTEWRAV